MGYFGYPVLGQVASVSFHLLQSVTILISDDGIEMVFRGCSLESLDSQCGDFKFEDVRYRGCVTSCEDNGCNVANTLRSDLLSQTIVIFVSSLIILGIRKCELL